MKSIFLTIVFLLGFQFCSSQTKDLKYFYVKVFSDSLFKYETNSKVALYILNKKNTFKEIEPNLFLINDKKIKKIMININNRNIILNVKKYNNNKFFVLKLFLNKNENSKTILKIERGDLIKIYPTNYPNNNIICLSFPQIIIIDGIPKIKGNNIFEKYILNSMQ